MTRQALGDGRWFDKDTATCFEEATIWNGNNHVSCATGSQWDHEELYRTASGKWALHRWSQYQGSVPSWELVDNDEAARWLVKNEYDAHEACAAEYAALEV